MRKGRAIQAAVGFLLGGALTFWLNWAFSQPERKLANLAGLLVLMALTALGAGLTIAIDGEKDTGGLIVGYILGALLTAIVLAFLR